MVTSNWKNGQIVLQQNQVCSDRWSKKIGLVYRESRGETRLCNVNGTDVEDKDSFVYLKAIVNNSGGPEQDIQSRLGKVRSVFFFHRLSKVLRTGELLRGTKMMIFKSNIIAAPLYGCETWRMTTADEKSLTPFFTNA